MMRKHTAGKDHHVGDGGQSRSLVILCDHCGAAVNIGIEIGPNSSVEFKDSAARCWRCGSMVKIPDGTFRSNAAGLLSVIRSAPDPRQFAQDLRRDLEAAKEHGTLEPVRAKSQYAAVERFIPNSIEKLAAYIVLIEFILKLLTHEASPKIELTQNFIQQYNEFVEQQPNHDDLIRLEPGDIARVLSQAQPEATKVGRNERCPCGSGKKYKKCCGSPVR